MDHETQVEPDRLVETTSEIFVGEWRRLVSTTNWEKGRIIHEWRQALVESDAPVQAYSDETWARRVSGVSSQHVGRLRRVHERFAAARATYATLYWSHFQAALDWNDAELWLEGAGLEDWSVADMRTRRWEAHGAPADLKPREEDVVATEIDDDYLPESSTAPFESFDDAVETQPRDQEDATESFAAEVDDDVLVAEATTPAARSSLAIFSSLPDDLLEAFESCKLAIVRHRLSGWCEVGSETVVTALEAMIDLARAPLEA